MEVLSEHLCQGWLEGYLLTGRHGLFNCYEAFVHIVDSMMNQHAKWLATSRELPWRRPIASLNYLLSSHVWRQDHNGASHQDPGFIDLVANKRRRGDAGVPAAGRQHAAVGGRPLPAQPRLHQRHRRRQAARAGLPRHGPGHRALHPRAGHLAVGQHGHRRTRRGAGLRRGRPDAGDPGRRRHPASRIARAGRAGGQRRRPDAAAAGFRAPTWLAGPASSTRCSPATSRSSSPTTATRG